VKDDFLCFISGKYHENSRNKVAEKICDLVKIFLKLVDLKVEPGTKKQNALTGLGLF
jgi:hypothetical protein